MTKKSKYPKLSFEFLANNTLVIHFFPWWFLLFIIVQLKRLAMSIIEIILKPIEAMEHSFFLVMQGLAKDYEELPRESDDETDDENEFIV